MHISGSLVYCDSLDDKDHIKAVWNACNFFFAESGLEVLLDKALIYFHEGCFIRMHALLEEMGKEIVTIESVKDPEEEVDYGIKRMCMMY